MPFFNKMLSMNMAGVNNIDADDSINFSNLESSMAPSQHDSVTNKQASEIRERQQQKLLQQQ
jgi:hypothetical protein